MNQPLKLDGFHKLLLATGQIQFLGSTLNDVIKDKILIVYELKKAPGNVGPEGMKAIQDGLDANIEQMKEFSERATQLMSDIADTLNDCDVVTEIDQRITKVPFEVLVHGMDEVENDYLPDSPDAPSISEKDGKIHVDFGTFGMP